MRVVFRVDSSTKIGAGHIYRCMAIAECMLEKDVDVSFICRNLAGNFTSLLKEKNIPVVILPAFLNSSEISDNEFEDFGFSQDEDAKQTVNALISHKPDWIIVDHYALDEQWERILRPYCNKLMVIDDMASHRHDCDLLLNQNYSFENKGLYKKMVPPSCQILLGPNYALLRKEFQILRNLKTYRSKSLEIFLVFFTAGNDQGETLKAMKGLVLFGKAKQVDIVIGKGNPDIITIKAMCDFQKWGFHCQIDYMPKLIMQSDLVIGGGGSSNWERCALNVPALIVILAENQLAIAEALDNAGIVINLGWSKNVQIEDYAKALNTLTPQQLISMSEKGSSLVDAQGSQRLVEKLISKKNIQLPQKKSVLL